MRRGNITHRSQLKLPTVYIDPVILYKKLNNLNNTVDMDVVKALMDLWRNYDINIRYLHVVPMNKTMPKEKTIEKKFRDIPISLKLEVVSEALLLTKIAPEYVVCFFGDTTSLPTNHKVYNKETFINDYALMFSNVRRQKALETRFRRRRSE